MRVYANAAGHIQLDEELPSYDQRVRSKKFLHTKPSEGHYHNSGLARSCSDAAHVREAYAFAVKPAEANQESVEELVASRTGSKQLHLVKTMKTWSGTRSYASQ
jgi:hypothetical protein